MSTLREIIWAHDLVKYDNDLTRHLLDSEVVFVTASKILDGRNTTVPAAQTYCIFENSQVLGMYNGAEVDTSAQLSTTFPYRYFLPVEYIGWHRSIHVDFKILEDSISDWFKDRKMIRGLDWQLVTGKVPDKEMGFKGNHNKYMVLANNDDVMMEFILSWRKADD